MKSVIRCTLLAVFLGSLSAVVAAGEVGDDSAMRTVKFADLDLSHTAGALALYNRIQHAAPTPAHHGRSHEPDGRRPRRPRS